MCRHQILAIVLGLVMLSDSARAETVLSLDGLPATYTTGMSFLFNVQLTGAEDLNLYSIDLTLEAQSGSAGVDFFFDENLATEPMSRYVFGSPGLNPDGFIASADVEGDLATLNLSDLLGIGEMVETVNGVNDLVATVAITTTSDVGDLSIAFDTQFLELLDDSGADIPSFGNLTVSAPETVAVIPEPSALCLCVLGFLGMLAWGYMRRKQVT